MRLSARFWVSDKPVSIAYNGARILSRPVGLTEKTAIRVFAHLPEKDGTSEMCRG